MKSGRRLIGWSSAAVLTVAFFSLLGWSGVEAFQRDNTPVPLAATDSSLERSRLGQRPAPSVVLALPATDVELIDSDGTVRPQPVAVAPKPVQPRVEIKRNERKATQPAALPANVKLDRYGKVIMVGGKPWTGEVFDHRPIRPAYTRTMRTTAYSPDHRSCGKWADGITASGKSVWMNGGRLVAADRKIPYGTIMTVPGYNDGKPVQVWDRGGAIKGNRLDLLYPTHNIARQWGVQDLPVVFWEFVDAD